MFLVQTFCIFLILSSIKTFEFPNIGFGKSFWNKVETSTSSVIVKQVQLINETAKNSSILKPNNFILWQMSSILNKLSNITKDMYNKSRNTLIEKYNQTMNRKLEKPIQLTTILPENNNIFHINQFDFFKKQIVNAYKLKSLNNISNNSIKNTNKMIGKIINNTNINNILGISPPLLNKTKNEIIKIVEKKCQDYANLFFKKQIVQSRSISLLGALSRRTKSIVHCHILESSGTTLIVGGTKAAANEFPHQAEIGFLTDPNNLKSKIFYTCGATLISENFVITAAHCAQKVDGRGLPSKIRFAVLDKLNRRESQEQLYDVEKIYNHPLYSINPEVRFHDISLIKLTRPVDFNTEVRPACMNTNDNILYSKAIVTGFGKTDFDRARGSNYLLKAIIDVIEKKTCQKLVPEVNFTMQMCAGVLTGGRDTCQGDSGGPLQIVLKKPYCMYSILGVTSYGKQCALPNNPSVYSRVSYYLPWIVSIVWPNEA